MTRRLFVLEQGAARPVDVALPPGRHELRDLGVTIDFDGERAEVAWLGFFPTAFLLPSPRQLQRGRFVRLAPDDRISWAGRQWRAFAHDLPGEAHAPARGTALNERGAGEPVHAALLLLDGERRGNFLRLRRQPVSLATGVEVHAVLSEEELALQLHASKDLSAGRVSVDGAPVAPGETVLLTAEALVTVAGDDAEAGRAVVVVG